MNKDNITFDSMPEALTYLIGAIDSLQEGMKDLRVHFSNRSAEEVWFNVDQLREYLPTHPARQTIYQWVNQRYIPVHKKSKTLMFQKSEIDKWLATDVRKTYAELAREAQQHKSPNIHTL